MKEPKRFWSKVDVGEADECWEWLASTGNGGYGHFRVHDRLWMAHRVVWVLTFGPIPEGLHVCHHCDNPGCVNPYHLFLGTQEDNMQDSARKGRQGWRLSREDIPKIRKLLTQGKLTQREIGELFGVSHGTISDIKRGVRWALLDAEQKMPVMACRKDSKPGYKYGASGFCYTYVAGNEASRKRAKQKAYIQGAAIKAIGGK